MEINRLLNNHTPVEQSSTVSNNFYHGIVIENIDPKNLNRIQVRIISKDINIADKDLAWCVSMNPSGFFIVPLVGEHVIVFLRNPFTEQIGRFFMGPINSTMNGTPESYKTTIEKLGIDSDGI